jgi:hypothetical protein
LLSAKRLEFEALSRIVTAMADGMHLERDGFESLVRLAFTMNGAGRYRKISLAEIVGGENPQRLHAEHLSPKR